MCTGRPEAPHDAQSSSAVNRRDFLRLGSAGLAGAVLLGTASGRVLSQAQSSLKSEFEYAARTYKVPKELLLAMGYVNTLWEMPPPWASAYEPGDLHGRGAYGIMQLVQNPSMNTLGRAAILTGLSEERLKTSRAANIQGGAAVLAEIQGQSKPPDVNGWYQAVAGYGDTHLYAQEVFKILQSGATATISTGESLELAPQDVEVPQIYTAQAAADYRGAAWRPAHSSNSTNDKRGAKQIDKIIIHVAQGSYSGTINWFQDRRSDVSAHYVVGRRGQVAQCVRNDDTAWHAGDWHYNKKSIGIEHAGYAGNPKMWTSRMYRSSAKLSAYLSRRFNIHVNERSIIVHRQVPGVHTKCPGRYFNKRKYLRLVKRYR
jgi:hypothetical protein